MTDRPIDPAPLLSAVRRPSDGGIAFFVGVVRDRNEGRTVTRLEYEAYGPMAEKEMAKIAAELATEYPGAQLLLQHRVGTLSIGEVAVVVVASAPHRDQAFAACRDGIERIKARVPIWKREYGPHGAAWLDPCQAAHPDETD